MSRRAANLTVAERFQPRIVGEGAPASVNRTKVPLSCSHSQPLAMAIKPGLVFSRKFSLRLGTAISVERRRTRTTADPG
jgi:hypothetical protein